MNVSIPQLPEGEEEGEGHGTGVVLIYGIIFGCLLIGCVVLVVTIMGLKYVQWSRREKDKSKLTKHFAKSCNVIAKNCYRERTLIHSAVNVI